MSVKVKINEKSLRDAEKGVRESIERVIQKTDLLDDVGRLVADDIKFQSKAGRSIPLGKRFEELSKSWIALRQRIASSNKTADVYSPKRSNLSLTGQLLNAIFFKSTPRKGQVTVDIENSERKPYIVRAKTETRVRAHNRKTSQVSSHVRRLRPGTFIVGDRLTNRELAERVAEDGRPFMGVRPQIVKRINTIARETIRRIFKQLGIDAS